MRPAADARLRRGGRRRCRLLSLLGIPAASAAVDPGKATAPRMEFAAPPPGSYVLQRIQRVSDAALLDSSGRAVRLSTLTQGKITLLTFFYTYCVDPLGLPFRAHRRSPICATA